MGQRGSKEKETVRLSEVDVGREGEERILGYWVICGSDNQVRETEEGQVQTVVQFHLDSLWLLQAETAEGSQTCEADL